MRRLMLLASFALLMSASSLSQTVKPKLSLDEFFNFVSFPAVEMAPNGEAVVIETERADWEKELFRKELWLYRILPSGGSLLQLTQAGHDTQPQWSPDSKWIAFLSERKVLAGKAAAGEDDEKGGDIAQVYLISPGGGEAFALTSGGEEVHSFAWSSDSKSIYFATREPWSKDQKDEHKKEWKDVVRYRPDERGDVIFKINVERILANRTSGGLQESAEPEKDSQITSGAVRIAHTPLRVEQMAASHNGTRLAFVTSSVSQRQEKMDDTDLYLTNLDSSDNPPETAPRRLTHNEAVELNLEWAPDDRHLFFQVNLGSVDKKYEDPQPRLYWADVESGVVERWFADFQGEVVHYAPLPDGSVLCACRLGTEVQLYSQANPKASPVKREDWSGSYEKPSSSRGSPRLAFAFSTTERPTEIYLAEDSNKLAEARPITSFNKQLTTRDLPKAKPYRWTSGDGMPVEGMLMYPPGRFEEKNLPMFVFIHGGPQDADGNHFEADWYQWDRLAATQGWLVFEPNYRGSTGYGDKFALAIVPELFSSPGRDILAGVDALVKDGIADPNRLAIGGYSYGGYMTNWLITQTTRFKAAVTGAGGVENVADWGNDDSTIDDSYMLGGMPWQVTKRYDSEAAIFQITKVRTPTHMVAGADDIRVPVLEDYLLDRALHELNIPSELLLFPGEGHELDKNPWHGKIKVREELKWLDKYGEMTGAN